MAQQIKITQTSNADMNIGVSKQTAVEWLFQKMTEQGTNPYWDMRFIQAKQMEEKQIKDAMMYALDEDGHTGDWKVKFIDDYYKSRFLHI